MVPVYNSLTIHPLKNICVVSSFWLFWIKLWIVICWFLYEHKFSFYLYKCARVQLLDCKHILNFVRNCHTFFQNSFIIFHSHQWCMREPVSPHPLLRLVVSLFYSSQSNRCVLYISHFILIYIFLIAHDIELFFMCLFASVYLFKWQVYLCLLAIFNWIACLLFTIKFRKFILYSGC